MKQTYQVTLTCTTGQYRPVSTLIYVDQESNADLTNNPASKKDIIDRGVKRKCLKRYWSADDLKRNHYTRVKVRVYDREKIEAEAKARYEKIKQEKYATGEWKEPKHKK